MPVLADPSLAGLTFYPAIARRCLLAVPAVLNRVFVGHSLMPTSTGVLSKCFEIHVCLFVIPGL